MASRECSAGLGLDLEGGVGGAVRAALAGLDGAPALAIVEVCAPGEPAAAGRALGEAGRSIREAAPDCTVVGSSAHGVIGGGDSVEMRPAVSVWMAMLGGSRARGFRIGSVPAPAGGVAITGLPELRPDDRIALLLADPWTLPMDEVVASFARVDGDLPVVGGMASGATRHGDSRLMLDGAVFDNGAVGVVLDQASPVRAVVSQGCRPIGDAMTVTAAQGHTIGELAGRPAAERLRDVVASLDAEEQALVVRGLHIGIAHAGSGDGASAADYVVRGILGVDAATGAIAVGDEVPVGGVVRLHLRDADSADADLRSVVSAIRPADARGPTGAYLVTCNGRGGAMFMSSDHDAALVREGLGTDAVGGFFAAGEIGPVGGSNHLHGFTAVVLVVDAAVEPGAVEIARSTIVGPDEYSVDIDAELRALLEP